MRRQHEHDLYHDPTEYRDNDPDKDAARPSRRSDWPEGEDSAHRNPEDGPNGRDGEGRTFGEGGSRSARGSGLQENRREAETDAWTNQNIGMNGNTAAHERGQFPAELERSGRRPLQGDAVSSRRSPSPQMSPSAPPPPPPPPPPDDASAFSAGQDVATRQRAPELDAFDDDRAWGEMSSSASRQDVPRTAPTHASRPEQNNGNLARSGAAARMAWPAMGGAQNQHASAGGRTAPTSIRDGDGAPLHGPPAQSKLVQRFFGARGRRGRGSGGGRGRGGGGRSGVGGEASETEPVKEESRAGAEGSWAVQAELQGKLRELEEEVRAVVCTWKGQGGEEERHREGEAGENYQGHTLSCVLRCLRRSRNVLL